MNKNDYIFTPNKPYISSPQEFFEGEEINLFWNEVEFAESYSIYLNGDKIAEEYFENTFLISDLPLGTHVLIIFAVNEHGEVPSQEVEINIIEQQEFIPGPQPEPYQPPQEDETVDSGDDDSDIGISGYPTEFMKIRKK